MFGNFESILEIEPECIVSHVGTNNDQQKCHLEITSMSFSGPSWLPML